MNKTGRDLGLLLAGLLLLLSVRVSVTPAADPIPPALAAQPEVFRVAAPVVAPEPAGATPHVEIRVLRVEIVRDLRDLHDAVSRGWSDPEIPIRLPDLGRCAS